MFLKLFSSTPVLGYAPLIEEQKNETDYYFLQRSSLNELKHFIFN